MDELSVDLCVIGAGSALARHACGDAAIGRRQPALLVAGFETRLAVND